jgi:predicted nucleotidyltransferase
MGVAERWRGFRELPHDVEQALERLVPLFEKEGVLLAYVFGSLGMGRPAQDVDLAVLMVEGPAFRLRKAITEILKTERLDLVDLRDAPPVLRFEIVSKGRPFYVKDEGALNRFELETLHVYRDTAPLRKGQNEHLRRRMARWSSSDRQLKSD